MIKVSIAIEGGAKDLAYETKVLLIALAEIVCKANNPKEIYKAIAKMANAEGVILKTYEEAIAELEEKEES